MIVKTTEGHKHEEDFEYVPQSMRKYDMCLNPTKCSFVVHAGKFMGFLLTRKGIEANPTKF